MRSKGGCCEEFMCGLGFRELPFLGTGTLLVRAGRNSDAIASSCIFERFT
jgi:hypothetical protein